MGHPTSTLKMEKKKFFSSIDDPFMDAIKSFDGNLFPLTKPRTEQWLHEETKKPQGGKASHRDKLIYQHQIMKEASKLSIEQMEIDCKCILYATVQKKF